MPPENEWSEDETSNLACPIFQGANLLVSQKLTPPKINMEFLKNEGFEDVFFHINFGEL